MTRKRWGQTGRLWEMEKVREIDREREREREKRIENMLSLGQGKERLPKEMSTPTFRLWEYCKQTELVKYNDWKRQANPLTDCRTRGRANAWKNHGLLADSLRQLGLWLKQMCLLGECWWGGCALPWPHLYLGAAQWHSHPQATARRRKREDLDLEDSDAKEHLTYDKKERWSMSVWQLHSSSRKVKLHALTQGTHQIQSTVIGLSYEALLLFALRRTLSEVGERESER